MIGRDTEMRRARFEHLHNGAQHTDHSPVRRILALGEATQAIEMSKQLVRAVDEVNDHLAQFGDRRVPTEGSLS